MNPFHTTDEQVVKLAPIMVAMEEARLRHEFIVQAFKLAHEDQGVYDLMKLWHETPEGAERDEIIADIQDSLDDYRDAPARPQEKPPIKFKQLGDVTARIMKDKAKLRKLVDQHGGISEVAQKSGIPQPSLSRMLSSASIPRRATLYKIANALGLPETDIVLEWTR